MHSMSHKNTETQSFLLELNVSAYMHFDSLFLARIIYVIICRCKII